jgi:hypothetical protein
LRCTVPCVERYGNTFKGTRAEVLAALQHDIIWHDQFGTQVKSDQAAAAYVSVVAGSLRVEVGQLVYEVMDGA